MCVEEARSLKRSLKVSKQTTIETLRYAISAISQLLHLSVISCVHMAPSSADHVELDRTKSRLGLYVLEMLLVENIP